MVALSLRLLSLGHCKGDLLEGMVLYTVCLSTTVYTACCSGWERCTALHQSGAIGGLLATGLNKMRSHEHDRWL